MNAIINAIKDVLYDTWPMILLSCIVLISLRLSYLIMNKKKFIVSNEIMSLAFVIYILYMKVIPIILLLDIIKSTMEQ